MQKTQDCAKNDTMLKKCKLNSFSILTLIVLV